MENHIPIAMAGIIISAIFFYGIVVPFTPYLLRLCRFIANKVYEYQSLDRGDFLTLLIDAGLNHERAQWFYDAFYDQATCLERCLIKLYISRCVISRRTQ